MTTNHITEIIEELAGSELEAHAESICIETEKLIKALKNIEEKTAKAFGGCTKCYGKGYFTVKRQAESFEDFGGEKTGIWELDPIKPCSCNRGKQIVEMKESIDKKAYERGFHAGKECEQKRYDLSLPFTEQSEEVYEFLHEILCK